MTEGVSTSNDADAASQRAAEQARLRKERREAKLKAGGSARLNKITGMGGRPQTDFDTPAATAEPNAPVTPSAPIASQKPAASDADPDEVDISQHFFTPQTTQRIPRTPPAGASQQDISDAALRQMMMGFDPATNPQGAGGGQPDPQNPFAGIPGAEDDPIMKMMSQMMGGAGGADGANPFANLAGGFPGMPQAQAQQAQTLDPYTSLWRLLHAIVALGLGLYIVVLTPFSGTLAERDLASAADNRVHEDEKRLFFWLFATAEACLLTTRFFLDKGRAPPAGIAWTLTGYLPEPWKGYVQVIMRYGQIFTTVRSDILACMFVLGVCSWWRA